MHTYSYTFVVHVYIVWSLGRCCVDFNCVCYNCCWCHYKQNTPEEGRPEVSWCYNELWSNLLACRLHRLKATPLSQPVTPPTSHNSTPSKTKNKTNSPLAEVVVCDSTSSDEEEDDDEQLPCYFPNYSLKEDSASSSPASSDDDKDEATEQPCNDLVNSASSLPGEVEKPDHEQSTKHPEQRLSSNNTNNTLTSSIILHSMRRKLFEENQCYVMDAKLQGNIGRFLNVSNTFPLQS